MFLLVSSAVVYALMVNRERHVEKIGSSNGVCNVSIFYKGGLGLGYDFRARVTSKDTPFVTVRLGIYDMKHDVDLDRIKIVDDNIEFDLYLGEKVVVICDEDSVRR